MMKITKAEIESAVLTAAPNEGEQWEARAVAESLARLVERESIEYLEAKNAWDAGRADWALRFEGADVEGGNAVAVDTNRAAVIEKHREAVQRQVVKNKAVIMGIAGAVAALGTTALTGGVTTPVLVNGLLGIGKQIADALNAE